MPPPIDTSVPPDRSSIGGFALLGSVAHRRGDPECSDSGFPPLELLIVSLRTLAIAAAATTFSLAGFAVAPVDRAAHHPKTAASAAGNSAAAPIDEYMKWMHQMHEKLKQPGTSEERAAQMAERLKDMQQGMAMMDKSATNAKRGNMAARQAILERRMDMMQSMMQMMVDQMQQYQQVPAPSVAK